MYHQHFDQIPSTQTYLKSHLAELQKNHSNILVSCDQQTEGHGRNNKIWNDSEGSVAFSFTLPTNDKPTLIPLFIALKVIDFFKAQNQLVLNVKWPNDLYYLNKKCGGIICQQIDQTIVVGIGLNLMDVPSTITDGNNQVGHLNLSKIEDFKKSLPSKIYSHILQSAFDVFEIQNQFQENALYLNQIVTLHEDNQTEEGVFLGIGDIGEAIIKKDNGSLIKFYNGTLRNKNT